MIFNNNILSIVTQSIQRANILVEEGRHAYATELLDTYNGYGKKYLEAYIAENIKTPLIQKNMKKLIICYPLLQNFIDTISLVYQTQPKRQFYKDGKLIVKKLTPDQEPFKDKYIEDEKLFDALDGMYSKELKLKIKKAEQLTNLLQTVVYKLNTRENKLKMDYIPNDVVVVGTGIEDNTQAQSIYFLKGTVPQQSILGTTLKLSYEYWSPETFELWTGENKETKPNGAMTELRMFLGENTEYVHNGDGFPPFAVLRSELPDDDFWNLKDKDVIDVIKQVNMAFTELRYAQHFGSFGLKYIIGAKIGDESKIDLTGIMELISTNNVPGQADNIQAGEFKNEARIKELYESIFGMVKFLYDLYGISVSRLVTTKDAQTAESKQEDNRSIQEFIKYKQDVWSLNEEILFNTMVSVFNRDRTADRKIPAGISMSVDFGDPSLTAAEAQVNIENWLVRIDNDIKTALDWMMDENPDLTQEEAQLLYEKNQTFNKQAKPKNPMLDAKGQPIPPTNPDGTPATVDENGNPITPAGGKQPPVPPAKPPVKPAVPPKV